MTYCRGDSLSLLIKVVLAIGNFAVVVDPQYTVVTQRQALHAQARYLLKSC